MELYCEVLEVKDKLIKAKDILKIVVLVLVIISMFKSCAQALSVQAINNMLDDMVNNKPANNYKANIRTIMLQSNIQARLEQYAPNYDNIVMTYNTFGPTVEVYLYNEPNTLTANGNYKWSTWIGSSNPCYMFNARTGNVIFNDGIKTSITVGGRSVYINGNNNNQTYYSATGILKGSVIGPGSVSTQFLGWQNYIDNPLEFNHIGSQTITINEEEAQAITTLYSFETTLIEGLQGFTSGDPIYFSLTNTATEQKYENTYTWASRILSRNSNNSFYADDLGSYMSISIRTRYINFNTIYSLYLKQGENELQEYVIFYPIGTTFNNGAVETIPSGDFSYNNQDATNDIINSTEEQTRSNGGPL